MTRRLTTEEFIIKSNIIHHNLYDYSLANYIKGDSTIEIICSSHGSFKQRAHDHLRGAGCPECTGHKRITTEQFIVKSNIIHNNLYDYSLVDFKSSKEKVKIICKIHGIFEQIAYNHLCGATCFKCGKINMSIANSSNTKNFTEKANKIHNNKFDYSKVNYINNHTKVIIICPTHGEFLQKPNPHLDGQGCPKCKNGYISKIEIKWLDSLGVKNEYRQKSINIDGKRYRVDAYDPTTNTIYEFYGDFWHGNPKIYNSNNVNILSRKKFGELYDKTLQREILYKSNKYNIISIWETDFKKNLQIK